MIKTSAMLSAHTIHVLHVVLRDTLIFLLVLFVAFFFWLKAGIHVDNLTFGDYTIDGLYIKLDKKLTLKAHNIIIPQSKSKPSFDNIDKTFDNIKYLFTFFDYIELEKVHFRNNDLNLVFADDILYVTSDDYEIAGKIKRIEKNFIVDISMLYIKKEDINIVGKLVYDLQNNKLLTEGEYEAYHIKGKFKVIKEKNNIDFILNSESFTDLKTLIDQFALNASVKSWIVDKVEAEKYRLYSLKGKVLLEEDGIKMDFDALKGKILFEDVKIHYKEGLSPVLAESFILTYEKGGLNFDLKNPMYEDRNLSGSTISVIGLVGKKPMTLVLDLHLQSAIDAIVHKILNAYDLQISVTQNESIAKVDVKMDIPLPMGDSTRETSVFVNVDLGKGNVYINKVKLPVLEGNIQYDKGFVSLKDIKLKESWYEGLVNGKINIKAKKADLIFSAKKIVIGEKKEKFFNLKNKVLPLSLDYNKDITAVIPALKLKIISHPKVLLIKIGAIKKLQPYLQDIGIKVNRGNLDIETKNFKTYTFKGILHRNACFFYEKDNTCLTKIPCSGKVTKSGIDFYAFKKRFHFNAGKSRIKLKNLNIDLKEFLSSREKGTKGKIKKLVILGQNSKLRYDKHTLVTDHYDVEIKSNGNIKAMGSIEGDIVKFDKKGKLLSMQALRVKDRFLHPLSNFSGLKKGRYTITISGDPNKVMNGKIIVEGGILSDFKAYNNTLAFMNTIPALAALQDPGFSKNGFKIQEGVVEYRRIGDKVIFDSVYIKGGSATFVGKGEVNIKTKTINMDLAIQTARELGKVVGSLPLLGYILMGKNKSITVGLKITGTLDKPKVQTSAGKDILALPLHLLKRTLESPAHIINK